MDLAYKNLLKTFVDQAIQEDVQDGDHTTLASLPEDKLGEAKLLVKDNGILSGVEVGVEIFKQIDEDLQVQVLIEDGAEVKFGDIALLVRGSIHSILKAERLVLNVMQRMSGISTRTAEYVKELAGTNTKVLDTRKTTPLLRFLEKRAVVLGGGVNHRFGLYDMILIKDNHVDYEGSISNAVNNAIAYKQKNNINIPIEVEVRSFDELNELLSCQGVDRVMFDNFTPENVKKAVELVGGRLITEASGGIDLTTIRSYALSGVDYISVGALTHSVKSLDLSLKAKLI
ncbi:carboxylating nicotinate-nucleotide diphosphorylase [Sphingobacterium litopenaei]|uniref:nicotinate-nucleotide diphosphorylase (carboxylating) n=1 Tax=Sphingobacterium litopenaei TaxID=2763500 RepID=A0ABR7YFA5_9SPHI|nr:carboxylating nicotinate-nucleotide diphosphorylase [Sphingobacterium litopenaei]MBD1430000.1 carboxylating nicotinate-nucleotide diphosphorylase [Sphingobacterium litopenaei]